MSDSSKRYLPAPCFYRHIAMVNDKTLITDFERSQYKYELDVDIQRGDQITGTFGKRIYEAKWLSTRDETPIVLIEMFGEQISNEVRLYLTLTHKHIIKTFGLVNVNYFRTNENTIHLLQEYARDGDLAGLLLAKTFNPAQNILLEIFIQITDAMNYISNKGIIHGDLGCRNVLVYKTDPNEPKKNLVKLTDFGLSQVNSQSSSVISSYPIRFAAPEVLRTNGQSNYSEKSDVYSFGVLIWEACSQGQMPFNHIDNDNHVLEAKLNGKQLSKPKPCDNNFWTLMRLCWKKDPEDRPSFKKILRQLQDIQKIESSSSSQSRHCNEEEYSPLFSIHYEICSDCNLRYTHYNSHLNRCTEQKISCDMCSQEYRRIEFENHWRNCTGILNQIDDFPPKLPLRRAKSERILQSKLDIKLESDETNHSLPNKTHTSHRLNRKQSVHVNIEDKPIRNKPIDKEDELPCQICMKTFPESTFATHQIKCKKEDEQRLEILRKKIELQTINETVECPVCQCQIAIKAFEAHEKTCCSDKILNEVLTKPTKKSNSFWSKMKALIN